MQAKGKFLIDNGKKIPSSGVFFGSPLFFFHMANMRIKVSIMLCPKYVKIKRPVSAFAEAGV